jgi:hypothetical protein
MSKTKFYILFTSLFLQLYVNGQEVVVPLIYNPAYSKASKVLPAHTLKSGRLKVARTLPFFEDFSYDFADSVIYPDNKLWLDSDVFINASYSINPVTIGVATFDALDKNGKLYPAALTSNHFSADKLTSDTIDLSSKSAKGSVYLRFYYQAGGVADLPESGDSLILEFYAQIHNQWNKVWAVPGGPSTPFIRVTIPIIDSIYFKKDFQFRFRNIASINSSSIIGKNSNADIWNVDYIQIDEGRSMLDTVLHDLAITGPLYSPLRDFESIPWSHFKMPNVYEKAMGGSLNLNIRNNDDTIRSATRAYIIEDVRSGSTSDLFTTADAKLDSFSVGAFHDTLPDPLISYSTDYAIFKITASLQNNTSYDPRQNDTVRYYQVFDNYYAYDDGTAEYGYGLKGVGTANAMVAYKFSGYMSDTLWAVKMFFNRTLKNENAVNFSLTVWDSKNGVPFNVLYRKDSINGKAYMPDTLSSGLNEFTRYDLDTPVVVPDTFFVGWTQKSETFLNVGLDINRNNSFDVPNHKKDLIYYNLLGTQDDWSQSSKDGALMIRPIVGTYLQSRVSIKQATTGNFVIYPNPAIDRLNIKLSEKDINSNTRIYIFDLAGKIVLNKILSGQSLDVGMLKPGLYLIRLQTNTGMTFNGKVIIGKR